jgi:hypothetical protein
VEDLADQAEKAAVNRNLKQLYDITKTLAGKTKPSQKSAKDKNGNSLEVDKQLSR